MFLSGADVTPVMETVADAPYETPVMETVAATVVQVETVTDANGDTITAFSDGSYTVTAADGTVVVIDGATPVA
jgi:hypothetical protein